MSRQNIPGKVKRAAFLRADGHCEYCGINLRCKPVNFDHFISCDQGGQPTLENCRLACVPCHKEVTRKDDMPLIAKGRRIRDRAMNVKQSRHPMPGSKASGIRKRMNGTVEKW